jgi:hypothetical protein
MKKIYLGPNIILFGDHKCTACVAQVKMLADYFNQNNESLDVKYYDLRKKKAPYFLGDGNKIYKPSWYFPKTKNNGIIIENLVLPDKFVELMNKKKSSFGESTWNKNTFDNYFNKLQKYGKNFDSTVEGFQIKKSWENNLTDDWGNPLSSGTLGREFGPPPKGKDGKPDQDYITNKIYSEQYNYKPRMNRPGDDLSALLHDNRNCNMINNQEAAIKQTGLFYDSPENPQIVTNQFGRKKRKSKKSSFGNYLYNQMGPSYELGNQFVVKKDTIAKLHGGATQYEKSRPYKVENKGMYIGQAQTYNPLKAKYALNTKIGEGTEIILNNGKLKFR